jgi:hypothetical protein
MLGIGCAASITEYQYLLASFVRFDELLCHLGQKRTLLQKFLFNGDTGPDSLLDQHFEWYYCLSHD